MYFVILNRNRRIAQNLKQSQARETPQWLRACTALAEDTGLIGSSLWGSLPSITPVPGNLVSSSGFYRHQHASGIWTYSQVETPIHTNNIRSDKDQR